MNKTATSRRSVLVAPAGRAGGPAGLPAGLPAGAGRAGGPAGLRALPVGDAKELRGRAREIVLKVFFGQHEEDLHQDFDESTVPMPLMDLI